MQLTLSLPIQAPRIPVDAKHTALIFIDRKPDLFRPDFREWLDENWHVYEEFERRANRLWKGGRKRYGARAIWETIRFDSTVGQLSGEYKLNDHYPPYCGRLWTLFHPEREGFFEQRRAKAAA